MAYKRKESTKQSGYMCVCVCVCVCDSLCYTPETNTTFKSTTIKIYKIKEKVM